MKKVEHISREFLISRVFGDKHTSWIKEKESIGYEIISVVSYSYPQENGNYIRIFMKRDFVIK